MVPGASRGEVGVSWIYSTIRLHAPIAVSTVHGGASIATAAGLSCWTRYTAGMRAGRTSYEWKHEIDNPRDEWLMKPGVYLVIAGAALLVAAWLLPTFAARVLCVTIVAMGVLVVLIDRPR